MNQTEFQEFVNKHRVWLTGPTKVPYEQIEAAEVELQVKFPPEFKWLLSNFGIWNGTGVQALQWIVASTKRLAAKNLLVLARTSIRQYDEWQGINHKDLARKLSGYVVLELKSDGVAGKVLWLRECLHDNLLQAVASGDQVQIEFVDFCDFIKQRVEKLEVAASQSYQQCPHEKLMAESPLVVNQENFPWELFMEKLGETISWNMVRDKYALELPDDLIDAKQPNWIEQLVYTQESRRHMLLTGGHKPDSYYAMIGSSCRPIIKPAENLAGGDLLLTKIAREVEITAKEQTFMHTLDTQPVHTSVKPHLYDAWGRPAPDYWVCQLLLCDQLASEAEKAATEGHYLVSWIPPGKFPQADRELKQFGYEHNVWLDKAPACLLQHFEDRHLISVL